jgi:hypothetical protein
MLLAFFVQACLPSNMAIFPSTVIGAMDFEQGFIP